MRTDQPAARRAPPLRFDRNELAGSVGDLGTDLPLLVGMILAAGLDAASVLIMFGVLQIFSALRYRMPMPVQPLKAMAALVISERIAGDVLFGGGLAVGVIMLVLTATGLVDAVARLVPKPVIRGIQAGLGLRLASVALEDYVRADGAAGYALAAVGAVIVVALLGNRRVPAAVVLVALGAVYAWVRHFDPAALAAGAGFRLPELHVPQTADIVAGLLLLALPQIPLSLANSVLATRQLAEDLFPERRLTVRQIGWSYSFMNLVAPFFSGAPVCHGSGGMAGHHAFGARTGGSVVIYGGMFLGAGLFLSGGFAEFIKIFPMPILGVLLLFEALALAVLIRDVAGDRKAFTVALLTAVAAAGLPYGFLVAMIGGSFLHAAVRRGWTRLGEHR